MRWVTICPYSMVDPRLSAPESIIVVSAGTFCPTFGDFTGFFWFFSVLGWVLLPMGVRVRRLHPGVLMWLYISILCTLVGICLVCCMCVCRYACKCVYGLMGRCMYTCMYVCMYVYVCFYVCMYVHECVSVSARVCIFVCTRISVYGMLGS